MNKKFFNSLVALLLVLTLSVVALADTIRLKDGSVIRGQVIGFTNQQFTVVIGGGSRGRRSQITIWMEDVESIEFDSAGSAGIAANTDDPVQTGGQTSRPTIPSSTPTRPPVQQPRPSTSQNTRPDTNNTVSQPATSVPSSSPGSATFFQVNTRVRGDNAANGWTNSGLVVRRGQRLRINASGRVMLGGGRISTPQGVAGIQDNEKLMRSYPTGGLIAVIGDDNDDFIFIGQRREFIAQRDGVLFLGVNEGNLNDNTGVYDVVIEAEALSSTR